MTEYETKILEEITSHVNDAYRNYCLAIGEHHPAWDKMEEPRKRSHMDEVLFQLNYPDMPVLTVDSQGNELTDVQKAKRLVFVTVIRSLALKWNSRRV